MNKKLSTRTQSDRQSILKSPPQIIMDAYFAEYRWGIALMLVGVLCIFLLRQFAQMSGAQLPLMDVRLLIPGHVVATFMVFKTPTVRSLSFAFSLIMASVISVCIWHIFAGDNAGFSHNLLLFSLPYFTFACCSITVMPRVIFVSLPIYIITLVTLFFKTTDQYDLVLNAVVITSFILNAISVFFIMVIIRSTDRRIIRLAEKQRAQLEELSFTEKLLNFALIETKQTIIYKDENGVRQHPRNNEFTDFSKSLSNDTNLKTDLLNLMTKHGYQGASMQDVTAEKSTHMRVLNHPSGKSYFTKMPISPSGTQTVLLSDVTQIVRAGGLLNAALNGNKIGVSCYDESGQLVMARGAIPDAIPKDVQGSLESLRQMVFTQNSSRTHASNFPIGNKFYDISFMRYGELNLVTHVDVSARVEVENELRASQKMSIIGELSSGIAHDYNNVLSIVLNNIELISINDKDGKFSTEIKTLVDCIDHASGISNKLLSIATNKDPEITTINVSDSISNMSALITSAIGPKIEFEMDLDADAYIDVVVQEFQTAILNIVMNARFAIANNTGKISINSKTFGDHIKIKISDDGPGIPEELIGKIFDPFFTTHNQEFSTGLGLAMVKGFMTAAGGSVDTPRSDKGASIELTFPISEQARDKVPHRAAS